jgi:hypothetical protein
MKDDVRQLSEAPPGGLLRELWGFLSVTKKWWLTPLILMMLLLGVLIIIGGSSAAPFIYTLF